MKLSFYPAVNNFTIDVEKLFMQFILAGFALFFIYVACRSMRIVEEYHKRTNKRITRLKTKLNIVLAQNAPVCENVLYLQMVRCRRSLLAGYIKDLIDEEKHESQRYSTFYQDSPQSSPNKTTFSCTTSLSEGVEPISKLNTKLFPEKQSFTGRNVSDVQNIREETLTTEEKLGRQEKKVEGGELKKFETVNQPLESIIFKTLEGQTRRTVRSNIFEKKKTKVPKWNMAQGLRNAHEVCHENLKVCSALNDTKSLLKVSSLRKPLLLKKPHDFCRDNVKVYTALINSRSPFKASSVKKPPLQKINLSSYWHLNTGNPQICAKKSSSLTGRDVHNQRNENLRKESHEPSVKYANVVEDFLANGVNRSVCSSGFESDCESEAYIEQSPPVTKNITISRQKSLLTTINEESAEETNSND